MKLRGTFIITIMADFLPSSDGLTRDALPPLFDRSFTNLICAADSIADSTEQVCELWTALLTWVLLQWSQHKQLTISDASHMIGDIQDSITGRPLHADPEDPDVATPFAQPQSLPSASVATAPAPAAADHAQAAPATAAASEDAGAAPDAAADASKCAMSKLSYAWVASEPSVGSRKSDFMMAFMNAVHQYFYSLIKSETTAHLEWVVHSGKKPVLTLVTNKQMIKAKFSFIGKLTFYEPDCGYQLAKIGGITIYVALPDSDYPTPVAAWLIPASTDAVEVNLSITTEEHKLAVPYGQVKPQITISVKSLELLNGLAIMPNSLIVREPLDCEASGKKLSGKKASHKKAASGMQHRIMQLVTGSEDMNATASTGPVKVGAAPKSKPKKDWSDRRTTTYSEWSELFNDCQEYVDRPGIALLPIS